MDKIINNSQTNKDIAIDKSVSKLIDTKKSIRMRKMSDEDARNQYLMAMNLELSKLKKIGFEDITPDDLNLKLEEKLVLLKNAEIEKSVAKLVTIKNEMAKSNVLGVDARNQYLLAINSELIRLKKAGFDYVTTEELDSRVDNTINTLMVNQMINSMEQQGSNDGSIDQVNTYSRQRGYTMIGILGLITCIVTIGIVIYGYILFYK